MSWRLLAARKATSTPRAAAEVIASTEPGADRWWTEKANSPIASTRTTKRIRPTTPDSAKTRRNSSWASFGRLSIEPIEPTPCPTTKSTADLSQFGRWTKRWALETSRAGPVIGAQVTFSR